jgi:hypothetical protein
MKLKVKIALVAGALTLSAVPALAVAAPPAGHGPDYAPAPPPQAKAHGFYCRGESKRHVEGTPGTPFSQCVKAMAQARKNPRMNPARACKGLSKRHVRGEKGTPFSRCVKAAAKLRRDQAQV